MELQFTKEQLQVICEVLERAWEEEEANAMPDADRQVLIVEARMTSKEMLKGGFYVKKS